MRTRVFYRSERIKPCEKVIKANPGLFKQGSKIITDRGTFVVIDYRINLHWKKRKRIFNVVLN